jgi:Tol biopolymer transport system component
MTVRLGALLALAAAAAASSALAAPPRGGTIYFWSDRGRPALYAMAPDGSDVRSVYRTPLNAKRPTPSPDGRWLAFDGAAPGKTPMRDFDVQVVRPDGTGRRTLAGSGAFELDAAWSPSGSLLSYSRQSRGDWRRSSIWLVRLDGSGRRRLARGQFARWSPDGSRLVLDAPTATSEGDLMVVDLHGAVQTRLTSTPELEQPAGWSPDGRTILFTRYSRDGRRANVFAVDVASGRERALTRGRAQNVAAGWSPDGREILFTSDRDGHEQIYVMRADGGRPRNLSRSGFADTATSWR